MTFRALLTSRVEAPLLPDVLAAAEPVDEEVAELEPVPDAEAVEAAPVSFCLTTVPAIVALAIAGKGTSGYAEQVALGSSGQLSEIQMACS